MRKPNLGGNLKPILWWRQRDDVFNIWAHCNLLIIVMLCILSNSNLFTLTFDSLPLELLLAKLAADRLSSKSIGLM